MKKYILWLLVAIFITFFIHTYNKNRILDYNGIFAQKKELFNELCSINKSLITDYQYYTSDEYIQKRAIENLGMVFVSSDEVVENVVLDKNKNDYISLYVVGNKDKFFKNIK